MTESARTGALRGMRSGSGRANASGSAKGAGSAEGPRRANVGGSAEGPSRPVVRASGGFPSSPDAAESLADRAYRILRTRLVMLDIAPGDPISESTLATEMGVGRTPLREALKRLEGDHLVVSYPRRGTFAAGVDLTDLAEITAIRDALFPLAARRAAAERGGEWAPQLAEIAAEVEAWSEAGGAAGSEAWSEAGGAAGSEAWSEAGGAAGSEAGGEWAGVGPAAGDDDVRRALMELDVRVHEVINASAGSGYLEEILVQLDGLVTRLWCLMLGRLPAMHAHVQEHLPLMRAILSGDEDGAEDLARAHVRHFDEEIRAVL